MLTVFDGVMECVSSTVIRDLGFCAVSNEAFEDGEIAGSSGDHEWCDAIVIGLIDFALKLVDEKDGRLVMAACNGVMKGGPSAVIDGVRVDVVFCQKLQRFEIAVSGGHDARREAIIGWRIRVETIARDEYIGNGALVFIDGMVECIPHEVVGLVRVTAE